MEPGFYWLKQGDEWIVAKLDKSPFDPDEFVWHIPGDDNDWDLPPGEVVGRMLEPPEWMVHLPDGRTFGPLMREQAMVHAATVHMSAKVLRC